eukprot:m.74457 g.74457  ORF g.74457 m.74457 type:complete len:73 (-) comp8053_c0_seq2:1869-2087(-)
MLQVSGSVFRVCLCMCVCAREVGPSRAAPPLLAGGAHAPCFFVPSNSFFLATHIKLCNMRWWGFVFVWYVVW